MSWLDVNADGIALMLIVGLIGIALLLGALFVERLVEPRHERTHAARMARARRAQGNRHAATEQPLPYPEWTPPSGWVSER